MTTEKSSEHLKETITAGRKFVVSFSTAGGVGAFNSVNITTTTLVDERPFRHGSTSRSIQLVNLLRNSILERLLISGVDSLEFRISVLESIDVCHLS